MMVYLV